MKRMRQTAGNAASAISVKTVARVAIDPSCIGCDLCPEIAPRIFRADPETGLAMVVRQPGCRSERRLVAEAVEICPVDAIYENGGNCETDR